VVAYSSLGVTGSRATSGPRANASVSGMGGWQVMYMSAGHVTSVSHACKDGSVLSSHTQGQGTPKHLSVENC